MADADFFLGEGDTAPVLDMICRGPRTDADPDGQIIDLTGATATFQIRPEDDSGLLVTKNATIVSPGTLGRIQFTWDGYPAGRYEGRLKITLASGARLSFPNHRQFRIEVTADPEDGAGLTPATVSEYAVLASRITVLGTVEAANTVAEAAALSAVSATVSVHTSQIAALTESGPTIPTAAIQLPIPVASGSQTGLLLSFIPPGYFAGQVVIDAIVPISYEGPAVTITVRHDVAGPGTVIATATKNSGTPGFAVLRATSAPFTPVALDQIRVDITYASPPLDGSFQGILVISPAPLAVPVPLQLPIPEAGGSVTGLLLSFIPPGYFAGQVVIDAIVPISYEGPAVTITVRHDVAGAGTVVATATKSTGAPGFAVLRATSAPFTPAGLDQIRVDIAYASPPLDGSFKGILVVSPAPFNEQDAIELPIPGAGGSQTGLVLDFVPPDYFAGNLILEAFVPVVYDSHPISISLKHDVAGTPVEVATAVVNSGSPRFEMLHATSFPFKPTALDQIRLDITYATPPDDGSFQGVLLLRRTNLPTAVEIGAATDAALSALGATVATNATNATSNDAAVAATAAAATTALTTQVNSYGLVSAAQRAAWQSQTTWSIDESNVSGVASNSNTGLDDTHPLLTIGEFLKRVMPLDIQAPITVRWLSNAVTTFVDLSAVTSENLANFLLFKGVPTVVQSGTLTAGTTAGSGNAPPVLEDTALASTWAAAGGISGSGGGRLIRKVGGNVRAWISKDLGSKKARCSWASNCPETGAFSTAAATFAAGDAYEVVRLPTFPAISSSATFTNVIRCLLVAPTGSGTVLSRHNQVSYLLCAATTFWSISTTGVSNVDTCCFGAGGNFVGKNVTPKFSLLMSTVQTLSFFSDWNGLVNTIQGGQLWISHSSNLNLMGTLHVYDCPSDAVLIGQLATGGLQVIAGSGNLGLIVNVIEAGCLAIARDAFAGLTATTSAAKPLGLIGATYTYADAIAGLAIDNFKDAGFFGGSGTSLSALGVAVGTNTTSISALTTQVNSYSLITAAQRTAWQTQATWSIDESNITGLASDANTGIDDAHPLLTIGEWIRRVNSPTNGFKITGMVTVRWLSNSVSTPLASVLDFNFVSSDQFTNWVSFEGVPTVVQSGTLTAGTVMGAGNTPPVVEDTAVASTWAATGGISSSAGGRMIRKTSGNVRAWVSKELGSKQARISWPSNVPQSTTAGSVGAASFASGDAYEVVSLPTFPGVRSNDQSPTNCRFLLLHLTGGASTSLRWPQTNFVLCSFGGTASATAVVSIAFYSCCFAGGYTFVGRAINPIYCLFMGSSGNLTNFTGNWGALVNTWQDSVVSGNYGCWIGHTGTMHVYDTTVAAVFMNVANGAKIILGTIDGSGNVSPIARAQQPNSRIISLDAFAGFLATTAAAKPLLLGAVAYSYADAIAGTAIDVAKDMGFFGGTLPAVRPGLVAQGLVAETFTRILSLSTSSLIGGSVYGVGVELLAGQVISNLIINNAVVGAAMTTSLVGVYSAAGVLLATSADQGSSWQSTGVKVIPLVTPFTVLVSGWYYFAVIGIGGTLPAFTRGTALGTGIPSVASSIGAGAPAFFCVTGQTGLPNPITPNTVGGNSPIVFWIGAA